MQIIYTVLHYLAMPFILIRLLWRSRHVSDYRKRWNERFGYIQMVPGESIWVHAVSVGETIAAIPLIKALIKQYPQYIILVTTTTPTGSSLVTKNLQNQVVHVYAPFDVPSAVYRFLRRTNIKLCIIMETELWPNLFTICKKKSVPIILANGRLSERSSLRYQLISKLTKKMLGCCHTVIAQGVLDSERYLKLGLDPKKLLISGNIKFDIQISEHLIPQARTIKQQIGNRLVLIAASTHDGEENIILAAFALIRKQIPDLFLMLAPRHADRFQKVVELCRKQNFKINLRSQQMPINSNADILLVDTIGELLMIYAASDIAFVGGSLIPVGGHNLLEPAALGLPILSGPNLQNFTEISNLLQKAGALQIVSNPNNFSETVIALCSAPELREKMGQCALKVIENNRGALQKHLDCIKRFFATL